MQNYGKLVGLNREWETPSSRRERRHKRPSSQTSPQHMTWNEFQSETGLDAEVIFAVVRDPLTRIRSAYLHQQTGPIPLRRLFARSCSFGVWVRITLRAAKQNPHVFDAHVRPQTDFFPENTHIFRLEEGLERVSVWLQEQAPLEQPPTVPHSLPVKKSGRVPSALSPKELTMIIGYYAEDYRRLGYDKPLVDPASPTLLDGLKNCVAVVASRVILGLHNRARI